MSQYAENQINSEDLLWERPEASARINAMLPRSSDESNCHPTAFHGVTLQGMETYERVVSIIQKYKGSTISVPDLSKLLCVRSTTLNARFRREHIEVQTVGRTNFIPHELALKLAELHKYALLGWPTLEEASSITAFKNGTLKARCEKGKLEGYIDLTKRLRINPAHIEMLQSDRDRNIPNVSYEVVPPLNGTTLDPEASRQRETTGENSVSKNTKKNVARRNSKRSLESPCNGFRDEKTLNSQAMQISAVPEARVELITRKNYGLPDEEAPRSQAGAQRSLIREPLTGLDYIPDQPFSISDCRIGKAIRYGQYRGMIVKLIDDPFTPRIQVSFPEHPHPAMREVQLVVGRKRINPGKRMDIPIALGRK
jgi:hypothetical protein